MAQLTTLFSLSALALLADAALPFTPDQTCAETRNSLVLRQRYRVPVPTSKYVIYVDSVAVHHVRSEYSTIAWQQPKGEWSVSTVGENGPGGLMNIEPEVIPETRHDVSAASGSKLDALLNNPALFKEKPRFSSDRQSVGVASHTMEIVTPGKHAVVRWTGRLKGRTGQVADIVLGRA